MPCAYLTGNRRVAALYLQQGRGLDALKAGLVFTILAAAYLVASFYAPALTPRLGRRLPALGGLVLAAGHALLAASVADVGVSGSIAMLVPGMLLEGEGMGRSAPPRGAGAAVDDQAPRASAGCAAGSRLAGCVWPTCSSR